MHVRDIKGTAGDAGRIGLVVAQFNRAITDALLVGALDALEQAGVSEVTVLRVPGALELPIAALRLAETGHDGIVALGAVIKGETDHYEHVAAESMAGLSHVSLATGIPIGNAVLTVLEYEHARDRSLPGRGNKGYEAAQAVLETLDALRQVPGED